eukprot:scaffold56813_cov26-Tisochrysis_lutea.AAC.2
MSVRPPMPPLPPNSCCRMPSPEEPKVERRLSSRLVPSPPSSPPLPPSRPPSPPSSPPPKKPPPLSPPDVAPSSLLWAICCSRPPDPAWESPSPSMLSRPPPLWDRSSPARGRSCKAVIALDWMSETHCANRLNRLRSVSTLHCVSMMSVHALQSLKLAAGKGKGKARATWSDSLDECSAACCTEDDMRWGLKRGLASAKLRFFSHARLLFKETDLIPTMLLLRLLQHKAKCNDIRGLGNLFRIISRIPFYHRYNW